MKPIRIYIAACMMAAVFGQGCKSDLLDLSPESFLTNSNFPQTAADIDQMTIGIYSRLQSRKPGDYLVMEVPSDNLFMSANQSIAGSFELDGLTPEPGNPLLNNFWISTYNGIFRANSVLGEIDRPTDYRAGQKDQFAGEAKFLRALFYFDLVRVFGDVPKVTSVLGIEASRNTRKSPAAEIYQLIVDDLTDAAAKLPLQSGIARGRASKAAAIALLAKVQVYRKDWAAAQAALDQFATLQGYDLADNFADLWKLTGEDNPEAIFSLKYIDGSNGHGLSTAFIPNAGAAGIVNRGNEVALPSWSLIKLYDDADTRKAATVTLNYTAASAGAPTIFYPYVSKYAIPHTFDASGLDLPVIRYADVVLLRAEVAFHRNQPAVAVAALNEIRERAFGDATHNYTAADIASEITFYDKLLLERQLEFAYENERWFDLTRTGRFTQLIREERNYNNVTQTAVTATLRPQAFMKVFPIPQVQIGQAAPGVLEQTQGYY
ncbi:RagB/SusD family nutrient uptake outer membrane protein [Chitinophaga pollutisoli]|uniref:RagB/SusD family nutrient uptake outer membrane protein n=1 Tax=Chitinophaga pollutisoli TaxID=3133966 RepID=A0ABZ2YQ38_9BACT